MELPYALIITRDWEKGGYVARFPELPGCITCADTYEKAKRNAEDCKRTWLAAALEDGTEIPLPEGDPDDISISCPIDEMLNPILTISDPDKANRFVDMLEELEKRPKRDYSEYRKCFVTDPARIKEIMDGALKRMKERSEGDDDFPHTCCYEKTMENAKNHGS